MVQLRLPRDGDQSRPELREKKQKLNRGDGGENLTEGRSPIVSKECVPFRHNILSMTRWPPKSTLSITMGVAIVRKVVLVGIYLLAIGGVEAW